MSCLLPIGTPDMTYLVDPFPLFSEIKDDVKLLMESPSIIKVMHGCVNDIAAFNRDFAINIVAVIDIQLVHREMMKIVMKACFNGTIGSVFDTDGVIERATGFTLKKPPTSDHIDILNKMSTDLISLKKLTQIYFPNYPEPMDATLADWRIRPISNEKMIDYAVYDAHVLMGIWQKMKKLVRCLVFSYKIKINETTLLPTSWSITDIILSSLPAYHNDCSE